MEQLHRTSLKILEEVGTIIHHRPTVEVLQSKGARVRQDHTVFIPESLVQQAVESAPAQVTVCDRNGNPAMELKDTHVYFGTGPDCQFLLDLDDGQQKPFTLDEMKKAVALADSLPHIDFIMSMGLAAEIEHQRSFLEKFIAMVSHTTKPLVIVSGPDIKELEKMTRIASLVVGDQKPYNQHPTFLLLVDPTSPLVHSQDAVEKLIHMAKHQLPVIYAPGIMAGATSPITLAGAIAQANAEILAGLVIHQLTHPGAPFVYGGGMSPLDMKSGQPTYSSPEAMVSQAGLCQLGRCFYQLPTWGFGGCSASKTCDEQAVVEASNYLMMSAWMGCNLIHDIGYLEFGITYSLELLTICDEIIGQIRHMMKGIPIDEEQLALDTIKRVGPSGNFLSDPHTFAHFRNNWQPDLIDRKTRAAWSRSGSTSLLERARHKIKKNQLMVNRKPLEEAVWCHILISD